MLSFIEVYYDKLYYLDCLVQGVRQKPKKDQAGPLMVRAYNYNFPKFCQERNWNN